MLVSLTGPISPQTVTELRTGVVGPATLACAGDRVTLTGPAGDSQVVETSALAVQPALASPSEASSAATATHALGCAAIEGERPGHFTLPLASVLRGGRANLSNSHDRWLVSTTIEHQPNDTALVRTRLRERVSDRVEREVLLFEARCPMRG